MCPMQAYLLVHVHRTLALVALPECCTVSCLQPEVVLASPMAVPNKDAWLRLVCPFCTAA